MNHYRNNNYSHRGSVATEDVGTAPIQEVVRKTEEKGWIARTHQNGNGYQRNTPQRPYNKPYNKPYHQNKPYNRNVTENRHPNKKTTFEQPFIQNPYAENVYQKLMDSVAEGYLITQYAVKTSTGTIVGCFSSISDIPRYFEHDGKTIDVSKCEIVMCFVLTDNA